MRRRPLGRTGIEVSEIGFGGSRIGGILAQKGSGDAEALLRGALDAGITLYDTADMYSQGESESLIGKAFAGRRDQVVLATKGGYCLPGRRKLLARIKPLVRPVVQALGLKRGAASARVAGSLAQDFRPEYLIGALDASLRRLRTDYVDLYQLHGPSPEVIKSAVFDDALAALETLKAQGKLRAYGIGSERPADARLSLRAPGLATVQLGFGLLDLDALDGTLAEAHERGVGVIARGCYGGGLLKESLTDTELDARTEKAPRIRALRTLCAASGRTVLETALQFCLATPGVSATLLGMHTDQHLRDNLAHYQARPLTAEEYRALLSADRNVGV